MKIFEHLDYKKALESSIAENKEKRGYKALLAAAAGCQRSFLSRVLNGKDHFTPEHATGVAIFWNLTAREREYFLVLVDYARAGRAELRDILKDKINKLRFEQENLSQRFDKTIPMEDLGASVYYSSWHYSAIHFLLTIPQYQNVNLIAQRLHLDPTVVQESLGILKSIGLVQLIGDRCMATKKNMHLPRDSMFTGPNHANWRQRASLNSFARRDKDIHYTALYSLSKADLERFRQIVFEFIDRTRKIVEPSPEEELACFACDLFTV